MSDLWTSVADLTGGLMNPIVFPASILIQILRANDDGICSECGDEIEGDPLYIDEDEPLCKECYDELKKED